MTCCPINELLFDVVNSFILGESACRIREMNIVEWWWINDDGYDHNGGGIVVVEVVDENDDGYDYRITVMVIIVVMTVHRRQTRRWKQRLFINGHEDYNSNLQL